jgi:hypothetical protein
MDERLNPFPAESARGSLAPYNANYGTIPKALVSESWVASLLQTRLNFGLFGSRLTNRRQETVQRATSATQAVLVDAMESPGAASVVNDVLSHDHSSGIKVPMSPPLATSTPQYCLMNDAQYAAQYKPRLMQQGRCKPRKQGHTCCGCCCDVRRAVIVVNLLAGTYLLMIVQWIVAVVALRDEYNYTFWVLLVMNCLQLVPVGMGIFGAVYYNGWFIGVASLHYTLQFLFYCNVSLYDAIDLAGLIDVPLAMPIDEPFATAVAMALCAYPHFMLISEIRGGIMSPENYENEQHSCCCV